MPKILHCLLLHWGHLVPIQQARQEIGSILRGDVGPDLPRQMLGISSPDIKKARQEVGGWLPLSTRSWKPLLDKQSQLRVSVVLLQTLPTLANCLARHSANP